MALRRVDHVLPVDPSHRPMSRQDRRAPASAPGAAADASPPQRRKPLTSRLSTTGAGAYPRSRIRRRSAVVASFLWVRMTTSPPR